MPVKNGQLKDGWPPAVIGGPTTVERKLKEFLELTHANELILFSDFYRLEDRLRSYEIVADLFLKPT